jgi:hypothetical protein
MSWQKSPVRSKRALQKNNIIYKNGPENRKKIMLMQR